MSRLTRDGTAESVSRDQILRHARGQGNVHFPCSADHEQDWQPYPVDPYSAICDDHTYIHTYINKPQRLRVSCRPPSTPKQPPYSVRGTIPETLQNLPGKTAKIPVPTDLLKLKISQISQISQVLHRFTISTKSPSLR